MSKKKPAKRLSSTIVRAALKGSAKKAPAAATQPAAAPATETTKERAPKAWAGHPALADFPPLWRSRFTHNYTGQLLKRHPDLSFDDGLERCLLGSPVARQMAPASVVAWLASRGKSFTDAPVTTKKEKAAKAPRAAKSPRVAKTLTQDPNVQRDPAAEAARLIGLIGTTRAIAKAKRLLNLCAQREDKAHCVEFWLSVLALLTAPVAATADDTQAGVIAPDAAA